MLGRALVLVTKARTCDQQVQGFMLLGVACLSGLFGEVRAMGVNKGLLVAAGACFAAGVDTKVV